MAMRLPQSAQKLLVEQGIVPPGCSNVELHIPAVGAMLLRYDVYVTARQLDKLGIVFRAVAADLRAIQEADCMTTRMIVLLA